MKLSGFGKLLIPAFTDELDISRHTEIINADGTIGIGISKTPLYSGVKCRISFISNDVSDSNKEDSNPVYLPIKIFCKPNQDIKKGDLVVVKRLNDNGEVIVSYTGIANLPFRYVTHQEVLITEVGVA